jgi:DNA polymerase (family 10)
MKNQEIARIFYEIADFLEMEGVQFKPYAYQKAAITLKSRKKICIFKKIHYIIKI